MRAEETYRDLIEVQPLKAYSLISVTLSSTVTAERVVHPLKASSPMSLIFPPTVTCSREVHPQKAIPERDIMLPPRVTSFRDVQSRKAAYPIEVTLSENVICSREVQQLKAYSLMLRTPTGTLNTAPLALGYATRTVGRCVLASTPMSTPSTEE